MRSPYLHFSPEAKGFMKMEQKYSLINNMDYELMGGDARRAQHNSNPAAAGAVRFAPMADADHAGARS